MDPLMVHLSGSRSPDHIRGLTISTSEVIILHGSDPPESRTPGPAMGCSPSHTSKHYGSVSRNAIRYHLSTVCPLGPQDSMQLLEYPALRIYAPPDA